MAPDLVKSRLDCIPLAFALAIWLLASPVLAETVEEKEYQEIKRVALQVVDIDDAGQVVVGIGRSPTPILSFLEKLRPGRTFHVPLSNFYQGPDNDQATRPSWATLGQAEEARLFAHFDRFLPGATELAGKRIVLLDFASTGTTLMNAFETLQKYFRSRGRSHPMEMVAMVAAGDTTARSFAERAGHRVRFVEVGDTPLYYKLLHRRYDRWARYDGFPPPFDASPTAARRQYDDFSAVLHARMSRDPSPTRSPPSPPPRPPTCLGILKAVWSEAVEGLGLGGN